MPRLRPSPSARLVRSRKGVFPSSNCCVSHVRPNFCSRSIGTSCLWDKLQFLPSSSMAACGSLSSQAWKISSECPSSLLPAILLRRRAARKSASLANPAAPRTISSICSTYSCRSASASSRHSLRNSAIEAGPLSKVSSPGFSSVVSRILLKESSIREDEESGGEVLTTWVFAVSSCTCGLDSPNQIIPAMPPTRIATACVTSIGLQQRGILIRWHSNRNSSSHNFKPTERLAATEPASSSWSSLEPGASFHGRPSSDETVLSPLAG